MQAQGLIYRLAGLPFCILCPEAETLRACMPSYESFREVEPCPDAPLFTLHIGQSTGRPPRGQNPIEAGGWFSLHTAYYAQQGHCYIYMHDTASAAPGVWAETSDEWANIYTDLLPQGRSTTRYLKALLTLALCLRGAAHGLLKLHASVVYQADKGLAYIGASGVGKSTHARLCCEHFSGLRLLNDDEPLLRVMPDGSVRVYGSPWSGSSVCYHNASVNLRAILQISQAQDNRLLPCSLQEALGALVQATAVLRAEPRHRAAVYALLLRLLESVPVYRLECLPELGATTYLPDFLA